MDYFLMSQDYRIPNLVEPVGIPKEWSEGNQSDEALPVQLYLKEKVHLEWVDFIERPLPLVSDELKQLLQRLEKRLSFQPVILADLQRKVQRVYWRINPPKLACLSDRSELNKDGTMKKLVLDPIPANNFRFFQIDQVMETYTVANLIVVESMLRRDLIGFKFSQVELES